MASAAPLPHRAAAPSGEHTLHLDGRARQQEKAVCVSLWIAAGHSVSHHVILHHTVSGRIGPAQSQSHGMPDTSRTGLTYRLKRSRSRFELTRSPDCPSFQTWGGGGGRPPPNFRKKGGDCPPG